MKPNKSSYQFPRRGIDLWWQERRFLKRMKADAQAFDTFVVSIPKSGRTWHRLWVGYYLTRLIGCDTRLAMDLVDLCKEAGIKSMKYTHDGSDFGSRLPISSPIIASPLVWSGKDVLLLVRDLSDTLLSAYHHARYRDQRFDGSFSEYIRGENTGVVKLLTVLQRWHANQHLANKFTVISYEQMHHASAAALRQSLEFFGIPEIRDDWIADTLEFTSFENMRRYEESNFFSQNALKTSGKDKRGRKVREGKVGTSATVLSDEDRQYIDDRSKEIGNPFEALSTAFTQNV